jgi:hypothetical protein
MRVGVYWHIFPTYSEAKDAVWRDPHMLFEIVPEELILKKNEQELVLYFKNGSILQLKGADQPERLLGANPYGVVLDEFAEMKRETWDRIIEPIIRGNQGWCWFVGTPRGKNHLYEFYNRGLGEYPEWKSWRLKASQSGIIDPGQLANSKLTMSQALFSQEWETEFLEGEGSVFKGVRLAMTAAPMNPDKPEYKEHMFVMGVDLAKVTDYTVIRVYDRSTNSLVYTDRFNRIEYPFQKKKIQAISKHFNNALAVIDATGIGDPIVDDLLRSGVPCEPVKITEQSKKELIEKLSIWIEQRKIHLLRPEFDPQALIEYDNFSYEIGPTGHVRYQAREGFHDDIVMADALAVWSLQPLFYEQPTNADNATHRFFLKQVQEQEHINDGNDDFSEWEQTTDEYTL